MLKKQARNNGIRIHIVPAYYTSQLCQKCGHIHKNNRKGKEFKCCNCGYTEHADINAANNIKFYLERFSKIFLVKNNYGEFEVKPFISKDFVKNSLIDYFNNNGSCKIKPYRVKSPTSTTLRVVSGG